MSCTALDKENRAKIQSGQIKRRLHIQAHEDERGKWYRVIDSQGELLPRDFSTFEYADAVCKDLNATLAGAVDEGEVWP